MSSSNRGSSAARTDADEETNVDDVVNLATDADDSDDQNYFDSLRHSNPGKRNYSRNASNLSRRFNSDVENVSVPFDLKLNDKSDPLAKLYDTAVLKIPKVIPSDNESIYSECNSSFSKSRFRENDPYSGRGKTRMANCKTEKLDEAEEEDDDLYEVIKSEAGDRNCDDSCSETGSDLSGTGSNASGTGSNATGSDICDVYVNRYMASGQTSEMSSSDDEDNDARQPTFQQRRHCDISSMGKMIVTIGGGDGVGNSKEASVSSGKLLIEVRDERSPVKTKPIPKKKKKIRDNNHPEESDAFDPDTLERGLGDRKRPDIFSGKISEVASPCPSVIGSDAHNPDYSFRLFEKGQPVKNPALPPDLPPKTRGPSSIYSSTSVSVCSVDSSRHDSSRQDLSKVDICKPARPKVPPKAKQKSNGLTAERKQYFEGLSSCDR